MKSPNIISKYLVVGLLSIFILGSLGSCRATSTMDHSWTDLNHAKELDKKKGNRSKKYQKNVARSHWK